MQINHYRFNSQDDFTVGVWLIDGIMGCFIMEDEKRTVKVYGETRIPECEAEIVLRTEGRFHQNYLEKFGPEFHKGMLCITNAPNFKLIANGLEFQYILFHIGNDDDDSAGCQLAGSVAYRNKNQVDGSTEAYKAVYPIIRDRLLAGEKVKIKIMELS